MPYVNIIPTKLSRNITSKNNNSINEAFIFYFIAEYIFRLFRIQVLDYKGGS